MCFTLKLDFIILKPHNEYYISFFVSMFGQILSIYVVSSSFFGTSLFNEPIPFIKACYVMKML